MDARSRKIAGPGDVPRRIGCNCGGVVLEAEKIEKMDARSRKIAGPGDVPRRIGCNCGGVVFEAEKVEILGKKIRSQNTLRNPT
ncbi:hypothetical protein F2Q68_00034862 [Brassica cretica]|uniref:Uncharacterized protein n=1 Tax=Brassica cretica TaxID=69181 RepID=A0A8S9H698_BRACR|nr:hypothetical protein F2Q68_00034862 [Brassica cretica]